MVTQGYERTNADHCLYVKQFEVGNFIIFLLYVDDMLIVGQDLIKYDYLVKSGVI